VDDSFLQIYSLTNRFYWCVNVFTGCKRLCHLSWSRVTWLLLGEASVTGWSRTKKSFSKIHPTKRQGSQPFKPRALASRQRDGKTNSPTGKRKTLIWDVKKEKTTGREHMLVSDSLELGFPKPMVTRFCGIHFFFFTLKNRKSVWMILWHGIF